MKNNICEEISKWQKEYDKKPLVDLSQYFTTKDKEIIKKLNIVLQIFQILFICSKWRIYFCPMAFNIG